jgi:AbrB family looped-hinge helix DNA binding protein
VVGKRQRHYQREEYAMGVTTTLTTKGQVTIPKELRERLGLKPYDRIEFEFDGNETLQLRKAGPSLEDVVGIFPALGLSEAELKQLTRAAKDEHHADRYRR